MLNMGIRKRLIEEFDTPESRRATIARDRGRCVWCQNVASDIHEVVSRSAWASTERDMELCFALKNRVCLCRIHHKVLQGLPEYKRQLLALLRERHGYDYSEREFAAYLEDEIETASL
jgi:5-methylcytosine-specific restriction endonuclease McrA